jgi:hypothetical protein
MTTQEKLIKRKQSLIELAEYLRSISQAVKSTAFPDSISMISRRPMRSKGPSDDLE